MRKFAVLFLGMLVATGLWAAPLCTGLLGQDVLVGGFSCQVSGLVFSNFSASNAGGVPNPSVILSGAGQQAGTIFLQFNPNLVNPPQDMYFRFKVTGYHIGADLHVGGAGASINEVVCGVPFVNDWCTQQNILANLTANSGGSAAAYYPGPANVAYVFKDINVSGANGHLTNFNETFIVPEPVTLLLIGSGLVGLGLLRRRMPKA